ncbi:MAG TPA: ribonuclease domain-containing protein, partial [Rhodanobacteraceae bacterium]|nr:ribonuclease domain-containing protein [Rhodanobacteraceae bacterium]
MRHLKTLLALALLLGLALWLRQPGPVSVPSSPASHTDSGSHSGLPAFLPPEAHDTLALIARGGPYPYSRDGVVFQNREHRLPAAPRGTYHEYTVKTPGSRDRGARRVTTHDAADHLHAEGG